MDEKLQSVLILKNLYFEKISFERDETVPREFKIKITPEYKDLESDTITVKLVCQIKSDCKFNMEVVLVGEFQNTEQDEVKRREINTYNTLTILFPYLRAEISLVTAQPNFPTIDLPVVNINALVESNAEITGERK